MLISGSCLLLVGIVFFILKSGKHQFQKALQTKASENRVAVNDSAGNVSLGTQSNQTDTTIKGSLKDSSKLQPLSKKSVKAKLKDTIGDLLKGIRGTGTGDGNGLGGLGTTGHGKNNGNGSGIGDYDPDINSLPSGGGKLQMDKVIVSVVTGRKPEQMPVIKMEFEETARVFVDVTINKNGTVNTVEIGKGTTTSNKVLTNISLIKSKQLKFAESEEESTASRILFRFINEN